MRVRLLAPLSREPSSFASSSRTRAARSPCSSIATSVRRTRSGVGLRNCSASTSFKRAAARIAGAHGRGSGETNGGDGVGELAGRVGRLLGPGLQLALELQHARAVDLAAEVARQQPRRFGPQRRELARRVLTHAEAFAELDRAA